MITPQLVIWESQRTSRKLEAGFTGPDSKEMLKTGAEPVWLCIKETAAQTPLCTIAV